VATAERGAGIDKQHLLSTRARRFAESNGSLHDPSLGMKVAGSARTRRQDMIGVRNGIG
jgi:hypothetical protein